MKDQKWICNSVCEQCLFLNCKHAVEHDHSYYCDSMANTYCDIVEKDVVCVRID